MLKQRVITALFLVPAIVVALFYLSSAWLGLLFGVLALAGAWEWGSLVSKKFTTKILYVGFCAIGIAASWFWYDGAPIDLLLLIASLFWVLALFVLSFYQVSWLGNQMLHDFLHYSGYLVIVTGWIALLELHQQAPKYLLFFFVLIWLADSAAYFAGKKFGRRKLAEHLSPGKTLEGLWGALTATLLLALYGTWQFDLSVAASIYFVLLCVLTALISVVGDLYESLLKRNAGVKDSGVLVPGHGGVLDRIDSLLAAGPGFVLGLHWLIA